MHFLTSDHYCLIKNDQFDLELCGSHVTCFVVGTVHSTEHCSFPILINYSCVAACYSWSMMNEHFIECKAALTYLLWLLSPANAKKN